MLATRRSYCRRVLGYRESQVAAYVRHTIAEQGTAPSYGMIRAALGIERGHVSRIVQQLERKGLLSRVGSGRVRRIALTPLAFAERGIGELREALTVHQRTKLRLVPSQSVVTIERPSLR